jgi:hypothetical protein
MSMFPGGNHKLRLGSYIRSPDNHRRMSLFLWLVHCAWGAGLTVYLETLVDYESYQAMNKIIQTRLRVFIPVSFHQVEGFLALMRATLEPLEDDDDVCSSRRGVFGGGINAAVQREAAWQHVCSVASFMAAHEAVAGCALRHGITKLSYNCPSPDGDVELDNPLGDSGDNDARQPRTPNYNSDDDDDNDDGGGMHAAASSRARAKGPSVNPFGRSAGEEYSDDETDFGDNGSAAYPPAYDGPSDGGSDADEDDDLGQVRFQSNNPITILRASAVFNEVLLAADEAAGVDDQQLSKGAYLTGTHLHFPSFSLYEATGSSLVYHLTPKLGGLVTSANELLNFNLPISQPSVNELRESYAARLDSAGLDISHEMREARTIEELEKAVESQVRGNSRSTTARPSLVEGTAWPDLLGGKQYADAHMEIWPTQALVQHRAAAVVGAANDAMREGKLSQEKARSIVSSLLKSFVTLTNTPTEGVNPAFYKVGGDLRRLSNEIEVDVAGGQRGETATRANRMFYHVPTKVPRTGERLTFLAGIMVQLSSMALTLNLTMAQVCAFLPIWISGCGLLHNRFGLMVSWVLIGPPDTGKSETASRVIRSAPLGLRQIAHQSSAKVATHNGEIGFKWKDEMDLNIATGKKGQAASPEALFSLAVGGTGYGAFNRFHKGDLVKGESNRVERVMSEQRGIEISGSNQELTRAALSRVNVITMYNDTAEAEATYPGRQERSLMPRDTPAIEAAASVLQLIMCYANMGWMAQAFGAQQQSVIMTLAVRIFNGMVNAMLVPAGFPQVQPRELNKLQTHSVAVMQLRVSRKWETRAGATLSDRSSGRALYMLKHQVVSFSDVLLAWMQLTQLSDTRAEESLIMRKLKAKIKMDTDGITPTPKPIEGHPNYYETTVRGTQGVSQECQELGSGIINTLINKLKFPVIGKPKVMLLENTESRGMIAILKSAVDIPQCQTDLQRKIVEFLVMVINAPQVGQRNWYPVVDDQGKETGEIAFQFAVKQAILAPHMTALFMDSFSAFPQDEVKCAFDLFVAANCMRVQDDGSDDLSVEVVMPYVGGGPLSRPACRRGLLDPTTALEGIPAYDAAADDDDLPTQEELAAWALLKARSEQNTPVLTPKSLPNVCQITAPGALVVSPSLFAVAAAVQAAKCSACNMKPPPVRDHDEQMERTLNKFINATMAISGEANIGEHIYAGSSTLGTMPFNLKQVGDFDGDVTILNPRRGNTNIDSLIMGPALSSGATPEAAAAAQEQDAARWAAADPEEEFLPLGQRTVTFQSGDNLFERMVAANARHNTPFDVN